MIPDKIYTFQDDGDRYWYKPEEWETPPLTRVEYIRKDALLEWAREKKKQLLEQELTNDEPSNVAIGINAGLDMIIGKLNSM